MIEPIETERKETGTLIGLVKLVIRIQIWNGVMMGCTEGMIGRHVIIRIRL